jgi:hypothetical protein
MSQCLALINNGENADDGKKGGLLSKIRLPDVLRKR